MKRSTSKEPLSAQVKRSTNRKPREKSEYDGDINRVFSTGSTLLDLAISGGRVRGGGILAGILVEAFGPSGSGKTVLLCELAGEVQRKGGKVQFQDPEARLDKQFAKIFGVSPDEIDYSNPDTVVEVFKSVRDWDPGKGNHGTFTDSLAALSTDMEMGNEEGDKMGMKRAKDFSEQLRKTCRFLKQESRLLVCSNQIRVNMDGRFNKYKSTGGEAIGFYSSLRLKFNAPEKIKIKKKIHGKEVERVIGVKTEVEVFKSSIWKPYRKAPLTILFDYGIDDIRQNLQFIKDHTKHNVYTIDGETLDKSMEASIQMIENDPELIEQLKEEVIELWEEIEERFEIERKPKNR